MCSNGMFLSVWLTCAHLMTYQTGVADGLVLQCQVDIFFGSRVYCIKAVTIQQDIAVLDATLSVLSNKACHTRDIK